MFGKADKFAYNPVAEAGAVVTRGCARFTVLTPRLVRCEWHEQGKFEDRATLSVANRSLPVPKFQVMEKAGSIRIKTSHLELDCLDDGKPFGPGNLSVRYRLGKGWTTWHYGQKDPGNLGGTIRTLDGCDGDHFIRWKKKPGGGYTFPLDKPIDLGNGLISRSGCAVLDDSNSIALGRNADGRLWIQPRQAGERRDLYIFAHGHDYAGALSDGAKILGKQPLPPRYAFGHWYSRYWAYTDQDLEELVSASDQAGIPLDVLVIDMDWHQLGWTGYTWSREMFPDHHETLRHLKSRGLNITLNLHPASGVSRNEEMFGAVCRDLGLDPKKTAHIPFDCTDPRFMDSYFRRLHHPHEQAGVDFWWMDWQQGSRAKMAGLDPLPWLNHLHWTDPVGRNPDKRPLFFSRFGGPGSGRYPLGFSGDTISNWRSLAYQPYFTATASNILYGYWSHDIGGHMPGEITPELYLRWLQFGIHSPVLRVHATKNPRVQRRIDLYPEPWRSRLIQTLERRYELVPYISSECRKGVDSGLSLVRPMYYGLSEAREAYEARNQYMFGDSLLVAPVVTPLDGRDGQAPVRAWLPESGWIDTGKGTRCRAGWQASRYLPEETPVFVRSGAIIPGQKAGLRLKPGSIMHLLAEVWADGPGAYDLIEDDGRSFGYARGEEAVIPFRHQAKGRQRTIEVGPARGNYPGMKKARSLTVRVHLCAPPESVKVGGRKISWSHRGGPDSWHYLGDEATLVINIPAIDVRRGAKVEVRHLPGTGLRDLDGLPGLMRRLNRASELVRQCSSTSPVIPEERFVVELAQTGNRISRHPASIRQELAALRRGLKRLPGIMDKHVRAMKKANLWGDRGLIDSITLAREMVRSI
jgi:alpha-glucosidase